MLETTILETLVKLPDALKQEVLHYVEFLAAKYANEVAVNPPQKKRQAGMMKGTFVLPLADDFDAPLEDFQEYME
ncbi:MAG: type II toxin-antitoxin system VapB family antitoxin [Microcoleus sp.]